MKMILTALFAALTMTATAHAADCLSADGVTIADGTSARLYYVAQPRRQVGPDYSCKGLSRVRTCNDGVLSMIPRECSQHDSGGCVDSWEERLLDTDFALAICQD